MTCNMAEFPTSSEHRYRSSKHTIIVFVSLLNAFFYFALLIEVDNISSMHGYLFFWGIGIGMV
jgi:hypothetical protein